MCEWWQFSPEKTKNIQLANERTNTPETRDCSACYRWEQALCSRQCARAREELWLEAQRARWDRKHNLPLTFLASFVASAVTHSTKHEYDQTGPPVGDALVTKFSLKIRNANRNTL